MVDQIFKECDSDGTGKLNKEKAKNIIQRVLNEKNQANFNMMFASLDQSNKGYIEKADVTEFSKRMLGLK